MKAIYEESKLDAALIQALDNTNVVSKYFSARNCSRILALLQGGAMAATKTTKIELLQAKDKDGSEAKGIPSTGTQAAVAEITANALVTKCTVTLATFLVDGTITINGLVFTAHTDTTTEANREFSISGNDTADAAELVKCINDETYGVPGVKASSAAGVVTLESLDPGETVITVSSDPDDATCVKATVKGQAFVEIDVSKLDLVNDFNHVAVKVTTSATTTIGAVMVRGHLRYSPVQKVGASAVY